MEYKIKNVEPSKRELEIIFTKEDYQKKYDDSLKTLQQKIELKGFRKGKVPLPLIQKMYGEGLIYETIENLINNFLGKEFRELNILLYDGPSITKIDKLDKGNYLCKVELPAFDDLILQDYKGIEVEEPFFTVTDELIEREFNSILGRNATYEIADEITDKYHNIVMKQITYEKGTDFEVNYDILKEVDVKINELKPEYIDYFINKKVDDIVEFEDVKLNPPKIFNAKILKIEKMILPEVNEELIKKISEDKFTTPEEYKEELSYVTQSHYDKVCRNILMNNLSEKLVELHKDFSIPKKIIDEEALLFVQNEFQKMNIPHKVDESILKDLDENFYKTIHTRIKLDFIIGEIIKKEDITVEDYDIENDINALLEQHPHLNYDEVKKNVLTNENYIYSIKRRKAMDLILDFATTIEVPFDEEIHGNYNNLTSDFDDEDFDDDDFDDEEFDDEDFDDEFDDDEDYDEDDEDFDDYDEDDEEFDDDEDFDDDDEEFDDEEDFDDDDEDLK